MTRFARAKGSKSSNEKVPEEATPWSELKKSADKKETLSEDTKRKLTTLKKTLTSEKPTEWASLDDENDTSLNLLKKNLNKVKEANNNLEVKACRSKGEKRKQKQVETDAESPKIKRSFHGSPNEKAATFGDESRKQYKKVGKIKSELQTKEVENVKKKKKKRKMSDMEENERNSSEGNVEQNPNLEGENLTKIGDEGKLKKVKKKNMKNFAGGKLFKTELTTNNGPDSKIIKTFKKNKIGKKADKSCNSTVSLNGVKLGKFQGFAVKAEDAKRLKELKKKMLSEGIPASEVESALKLERRRCEKSLARMKKNVCFNCRKPGHILSQCPEVQENVDTAHDVCYRCGSTEHKAYTCKVASGKSFPFAQCFICKERGHITRECPDNSKGLYPRGGCCILCGAVTHLKRDCPKRMAELEEKTIKLATRDDRNVEGLEDIAVNIDDRPKNTPKKPVKF